MISRVFGATIVMAALLVVPGAVHADTWNIDASHSTVGFAIRHMGLSKVHGQFDSFSGEVEFDGENLENGSVVFEIDAASIDTHDEKRDGHLRGADFFDVENHPTIRFKSTGVKVQEDGFILMGRLSMYGKEMPVEINCRMHGPIDDPWGNKRAGFEGEVTVKREDWGIGWASKKYHPPLIGNDVEISIALEAVQG